MKTFVYSHIFEFIHSARSQSFIVSSLVVVALCCCCCVSFGFLIYIDAVFSIALETNFFFSFVDSSLHCGFSDYSCVHFFPHLFFSYDSDDLNTCATYII